MNRILTLTCITAAVACGVDATERQSAAAEDSALTQTASGRDALLAADALHTALEAFDAEAVDYVLKPFDDDRFARALGRAKAAARADRTLALAARLSAEVSGTTPEAPRYLERIAIPDREGVRALPI